MASFLMMSSISLAVTLSLPGCSNAAAPPPKAPDVRLTHAMPTAGVDSGAQVPPSWASFHNTAYCYKLRCPPGAEVDSSDWANLKLIFMTAVDSLPDAPTTGFVFTVEVEANPKALSSRAWVKDLEAHDKGDEDEPPLTDFIREREAFKIGTLDAYRIRVWSFDQHFDHVYVGRAQLMYHLSYPAKVFSSQWNLDPYLKRFPIIVDTFVLTDEPSCRKTTH